METYDWPWIERQAAQTALAWRRSTGISAPSARSYTADEQARNEQAYDEALSFVENELRSFRPGKRRQTDAQNRIIAAFAQFSSKALGLDEDSTKLLTHEFLPVGTSLARWARRFDPDLSMPGIIQASRNAWTACGMQPLLGMPIILTPSILGYSLLYPYSDNLLDDDEISAQAKLDFSSRFRRQLIGEDFNPENSRERCVSSLIALVESQYPRPLFPNVYECLLAIHRAQEQSVSQIRRRDPVEDDECLRVSCCKGGSSVLADACLAYGSLTSQQAQFAFEWGVLLQLGDDLQDVLEDMARGSMTLFSRAAGSGKRLDGLTIQLMNFSDRVGALMDALPYGTGTFKELLKMSWRSLIVSAVADSHEFFSDAFLQKAEAFSAFRFEFLRARRQRVSSHQGLYANLFGALVDARDEFDDRLPPPEQWISSVQARGNKRSPVFEYCP